MIPDPQEVPLMTVPEFAVAFRIGRSAAYEAVKRGEVPVVRFGRRIFVLTAEARAMVGLGIGDGALTTRNSDGHEIVLVAGAGENTREVS